MNKKRSVGFMMIFLLAISLHFPQCIDARVFKEVLQYDNEKVTIDIYSPGAGYRPVAILIHGAAGISGDRAERYKGFATDLMNEGIIAINVHYFESKRPNWLKTIIEAISYAERIPNVKKHKIGLIGYSLGGTIALKVASMDDRVKLLAINAGYMPAGFSKRDAANLPKTFMISGTNDSAINTLNQLSAWFKELNIPFETKINQGMGHSVPMSIFRENWQAIVDFYIRNFK